MTAVTGATLLEYKLIQPLKVASAEADLWLMEHQTTAEKYVLKLYRYGLHPKLDVLEKIKRLRREHVVAVVAAGELDGRQYEIQEFITGGSLADLLKEGVLSEPKKRAVLAELTAALAHLHEVSVLHRDIKPSNILVRSQEPIDLILTDFGISSLSETSLHLTTGNRTVAYSAPETLTGVISPKSDWWSVGVLMFEMLAGHHPLAGLNEQSINFQLVSKGIPIPPDIQPPWRSLLQGLLTRDHEHRWGADQIHAWLAGQPNIPVVMDSTAPPGTNSKPYKFAGKEFVAPRELAAAFAQNWAEAVKHCAWGFLNQWVEKELRQEELAVALKDLTMDFQLTGDQRAALVILLFHQELPFIFKSQIVDVSWCQQNAAEALALAQGPMLKWLRRLKKEEPLQSWITQRNAQQKELQQFGLPLDQDLVFRLLSAPKTSVISAACEQRTLFVGAKETKLQTLLEKSELTQTEAVVLLACRRELLLTAAQKKHWDRLAALKSFGMALDWQMAERLVLANSWETLQPDWEERQAQWRRRQRTHLPLSHERLKHVLENSTSDYLEAVAVIANRLDFVNSLGMRFVTVSGLNVLVSVWATRKEDFTIFTDATGLHWKEPKFRQEANHPAVNMTWEEATAFCQWLTAKERQEKRIGATDEYRLPYDLEWSHAVGLEAENGHFPIQRAGKIKGVFPWGAAWPPPANTANVSTTLRCDAFTCTAPVGSFPANHHGLYDLGTNINEWCWDWYDPHQATKTIRGASWFQSTPESYFSSARRFFAPNTKSDSLGFRCVLVARTFTVPDWPARLPPETGEGRSPLEQNQMSSTKNEHE